MDEFQVAYEVFSPRWGHTDRYQIVFTQDELRVSQANFSATCKRDDNGDPEWSGYNDEFGNPLMKIFQNDSIYVPSIVPSALEWAWQRWLDEAVSNATLKSGLDELFAWIDQTARGKPKGELWQGAF
ncbi:MAG TPA: hypothetical protein VNA25_23765 [Phycisphaerae bacterium]|nr:hypothetical protein [Phycisphaerae bacterium]